MDLFLIFGAQALLIIFHISLFCYCCLFPLPCAKLNGSISDADMIC